MHPGDRTLRRIFFQLEQRPKGDEQMGSKQAHLQSCKVFSELHLFLLPVQKEQVATLKHSSVIHQLLILVWVFTVLWKFVYFSVQYQCRLVGWRVTWPPTSSPDFCNFLKRINHCGRLCVSWPCIPLQGSCYMSLGSLFYPLWWVLDQLAQFLFSGVLFSEN